MFCGNCLPTGICGLRKPPFGNSPEALPLGCLLALAIALSPSRQPAQAGFVTVAAPCTGAAICLGTGDGLVPTALPGNVILQHRGQHPMPVAFLPVVRP